MNKIKFVENSPDNMHCVNAVFRMVYQYFFAKDLTWEEIDTLTKAIPGKATWTFIGEMEFAKLGLEVINIEPLDYKLLFEKGIDYLKGTCGENTAEYYINKSNIEAVIKYIPDYLKIVKHETRRATIAELIEYLEKGALIGVELNSRILNKRDGFSLHFVLLYGFDDKGFYINDPGLPPIEARYVTFEEFDTAFNFEGANGGVVVFNGGG